MTDKDFVRSIYDNATIFMNTGDYIYYENSDYIYSVYYIEFYNQTWFPGNYKTMEDAWAAARKHIEFKMISILEQ